MGTVVDFATGSVRNKRVVIGMAAMYLWTWLIYWGGPFSLRGYTIELTNARWGVNVCMGALAVGAVLFLSCNRGCNSAHLAKGVRLSAMLSALVGTVLGLIFAISLPLPEKLVEPLALTSGFFTGLGEGLLLCQWCSLTSSLGMRAALSHNAMALALGGVLFLVCNVSPTWISLGMGLVCPVIGLAAARQGSIPCELEKTATPPSMPLSPLLHDKAFVMLVALAFIFGLSNGFINAGFEVVPQGLYRLSCFSVIVGTILASALTFFAAFALKLDAWQLVLCVSLPLMAVAYLLFPYDVFWYIGWGVHALGYQFFFMLLWSLLGSRQLRHDVPVTIAVPAGLFSVEVGSVLGLAIWNLFCTGIDQAGEHLVSGLALMSLVLVAVLFERPQFAWGDVHPGVASPSNTLRVDDYEQIMGRIRIDYALSPREHDVCALLGRGRNRQFVADELGISLETAKTHTTNVYRKLGVHSQQELLDVIEMVRNTLALERNMGLKDGPPDTDRQNPW